MTWLKIHRPGSSPGFALPSSAYCFASVVWTKNKNVTISDHFILFYFDSETALKACVLRAATKKKGCQLFLRKKVHPGDLAGDFRWHRHCTLENCTLMGIMGQKQILWDSRMDAKILYRIPAWMLLQLTFVVHLKQVNPSSTSPIYKILGACSIAAMITQTEASASLRLS